MTLTIPIRVKIRDARLNVTYYFAFFITGSTIIAYVILNKLWNSEHQISSADIVVQSWVSPLSDSVLQDIQAKKKDAPFCEASKNFWYDVTASLHLRPSGCLRACLAEEHDSSDSRHGEPCEAQIRLHHSSDEQTFITTLHRTESTDSFGNTQSTSLFSPYAESYVVVFAYKIATSVPGWSRSRLALQPTSGSSLQSIISVIIDSQGRVDSVWNRHPKLSVAHILKLSGQPEGFLDQSQNQFAMNANKSHNRRYPIVRITGVVITAQMHCTVTRNENVAEFVKGWDTTKISFWCTIGFERRNAIESGWIERTYFHGIGRNQSALRLHPAGVKLVFVKSGTVHYTDPLDILMRIASFIVFMQLPRRLILFFIRHCLGHLSTIYERYLFREVSIANAFVGNLIHVFRNAGKFDSIARICKAKEAEIGPLFAAELEKVLIERSDCGKIDSDALAYFVHEALKEMENNAIPHARGICGVKKALTKDRSETKREASRIDVLIAAAEKSELRTFQDAVDTFGVDRKIGLIERFFQPPFFKQALHRRRLDGGPSTLLPPSTESQQDKDRNDEDRFLQSVSMQGLSKRHSLIEAVDGESSDLGLERRLKQHRAEVEEKIHELREMMECILQRLALLEVSTVSPGSDAIGNFSDFRENPTSDWRVDPGDSMMLIGGSSCGEEPSQIETHRMGMATEGIEAELTHLERQVALCASTDSETFHSKAGKGLVGVTKVGATHSPHHGPRSFLGSGQGACETLIVPPHSCESRYSVSRGYSTANMLRSGCKACHLSARVPLGT